MALRIALVDTFVIYFLGTISLSDRLLLHLPMVPFVAGVGYEGIKLSARNDSIFLNILKKPGLWLQNITTKQPDDEQVEVALRALKEAFGNKLSQYSKGETYVAEAIG